ncbi:MAG: thymidine phosphorylase [Oscillospiraceae bacterium]|jgi:pyrimidine-nucleoside phosphorylase|nr:thymidine phosphorylase [Oscillospiraceae bacterium]
MADILEILRKKRDGMALTADEINAFVTGAGQGSLPDYQLAALLMAIRIQGMDARETRDLTLSMAHSGQVADLSGISGVCVDKHSTGGVGDTTTLVLAPLCAACGAKVAKMSGRGLGHTGGTLDKIESIPGARVDLSMEAFRRQVQQIGCAVIAQSGELAPADGRLYALRDVTATVDSLPLIVSSIMSKKIAAGAQAIVLDVKTGSGALMRTEADSLALAKAMVEVGKLAGRPTQALVTGMDQPLGTHIGNALEVKEAIDVLAGRVSGRLLDVSLRLGAMMLVAGGYAPDENTATANLRAALADGRGLATLRAMIEAQGGDGRITADTALLPRADRITEVLAARDGYVDFMDTEQLGLSSQQLGAGRARKSDAIDPAVGVVMRVSLGDKVRAGQPLADVHANDGAREANAHRMIAEAVRIADAPAPVPPLVRAVVRPEDCA